MLRAALSRVLAGLLMVAWMPVLTTLTRAGVVVFANDSDASIGFELVAASHVAPPFSLAPGEIKAAAVEREAEVRLASKGQRQAHRVAPNHVYVFAGAKDSQELREMTLPESHLMARLLPEAWQRDERSPAATPTVGTPSEQTPVGAIGVVRVRVLVDDEEVMTTERWQNRLRERLSAASQIIEAACRMRFEPVDFGTWDSDDRVNDFSRSLREFTREADRSGVDLVIGFSSQYRAPDGPTRLGGIRGPFFPHLLVREWPQHQSEPERMEVLVHELAHYLGAAHSADSRSALRPVLGDRQANAAAFRVGYDPFNTLVLNLVADEWRLRGVRAYGQLQPAVKAELARVYVAIARVLPYDPAAVQYIRFLGYETRRLEVWLDATRGPGARSADR